MNIFRMMLTLMVMVLLSGCGDEWKPDTMSIEDLSIVKVDDENLKVGYGMKRSDAEKVLGTGEKFTSNIDIYEHGVSVVYRVNPDSGEETVVLIGLTENSQNAYRTMRGVQVGDRTSDILALYGEKYLISGGLSYAYQYDLQNKKFIDTVVTGSKEDAYEQIRTEFIVGKDGHANKIYLFDLHAGLYLE
ncbi:hypothetical protein [Paenibacillus dendritiformis]|uniref:Lipoprotein n=1 Tax=Paenibacillus dendritiformis C454 TaxID=1131935 RepID=H3SKH8_9BACL|nr:hypothetical protein [Paenibacillus dendritiformis]EHQ60424.1 hypothetical protein PDENDC454_20310 [Paenibacillus dendritiformis C454]CAH8769307.1 hypothetical protein H7S4_002023 [Paenibacillus dendritiformis]